MKHLVPLLFATAILTPALPVSAGVVFEDGFEKPTVTSRTPKANGADISKPNPSKPEEKPAWSRFEDQPNIGAEGGGVVAGLTNQMAHKGAQSLFIEASKLSAPYIGALFVTRPIPVEGGKFYKASLWGRNDTAKPLIAAMAQLFLKVQIDFFTDEGKTETGESQYLLQPLPGGKGRPPTIPQTEWNSVSIRFGTPADAKFMVVSFRCDSSAEKGAISGLIYFDDFTVETDQRQPSDDLLDQLLKEAKSDAASDAKPDAKGLEVHAVPAATPVATPSPTPAKP